MFDPRRALTLVTGPAAEPVTLETAKAHLRLEITDDDIYVEKTLIPAARGWVERYCRRAMYKQTWCLTLDSFPTWDDCVLVIPPFIEVSSIKYAEIPGAAETTLEESAYTVDIADEDVRIAVPNAPVAQVVKINYISGYTDGVIVEDEDPLPGDPLNKIPPEMKMAVLILVAHLYENREILNMSMGGGAALPFGVEDLLSSFRSIRF